jgi:hypothetical protein
MKHLLAIALLAGVLRSNVSVAQSSEYKRFIKLAEAAYNAKHYDTSVKYYAAAFATEAGKGLPDDRYNAACSWALAGNIDSAFYNLFAITQLAGYRNYAHLMSDEDLESLHQYKAWDVLRKQVLANLRRRDPVIDVTLADELEDILVLDQRYRNKLDETYRLYGKESRKAKALTDTLRKYDAQNLKRIKALLDSRGWIPRSQIGSEGVTTVFLVLQHADSATHSKYLPMLHSAVLSGELPKDEFALFEDRTRLEQGKKQLYGSQIMCHNDSCYVLPLEDPILVDERRRSMGLGPLATYVKQWNIAWDAIAYQKRQKDAEHNGTKH